MFYIGIILVMGIIIIGIISLATIEIIVKIRAFCKLILNLGNFHNFSGYSAIERKNGVG